MSDIHVHFEPGIEWRLDQLPPKSIALDGACQGPAIDVAARRYSFDHHAGCVRLATSASCQQVFDAIIMGFDPCGHSVWINDIDGGDALHRVPAGCDQ